MRIMRICFIGDSVVNGAQDPACLGWAGRVCAAARHAGHDVTYYNLGVRHDTSADVDARWREEVARRLPPQYDGRVVFSFGINDTMEEEGRRRVAFDDSRANTRRILTDAMALYPVLMVGPPPVSDAGENEEIARLSDALASVCAELGVPYLDVFGALAAHPTWIPSAAVTDGYHPRDEGYAAFAALVEAWQPWQSWFDEAG